MIACAQSTHSVTDIFAHAAYFALGINLTENRIKAAKDINFKNVMNKILEENFSDIRNSMMQLLDHDLYINLEKLVNQGKHRGLAEPIIAIEWKNQLTPYKVKFPKYFFNEKLQSECEFQKFLSQIYAMTSQMTVRTGVLINRFLQTNY